MDFNAVDWRFMDAEWRSLVGKIVDLPPTFSFGHRKYGLYTAEVDGQQELTFTLARAGAESELRWRLEPQTAEQWLALWEGHRQ